MCTNCVRSVSNVGLVRRAEGKGQRSGQVVCIQDNIISWYVPVVGVNFQFHKFHFDLFQMPFPKMVENNAFDHTHPVNRINLDLVYIYITYCICISHNH